jgi:hypothetical protein
VQVGTRGKLQNKGGGFSVIPAQVGTSLVKFTGLTSGFQRDVGIGVIPAKAGIQSFKKSDDLTPVFTESRPFSVSKELIKKTDLHRPEKSNTG